MMTVMLGMNDGGGGGGGYTPSNDEQRFNRYKAGMEHIVQTVKQALPNLRITLLEPSPYDDVTEAPQPPDGYNAVLVRYGQFLRERAERNRL